MRKKTMMRIFFTGEIILFSWLYIYGSHGMKAVARIRQENSLVEQQITVVQQEVAQLETQLLAWQSNDFLKEKVAREQLQLARDGDQIYTVN